MKLSYDKANEPITRKEQQSQPPISIASEWTAPTVDNIAYPCWQGNAIRLYSWGFYPMPRPKGHGPFTKRCTALSEPNPQNRHRRFAKCCTALSELNPQKPAFGCKQLSGCIHGAPPHTPPKGTFCKKSPWESRKTAFDFYCLVFHRLLSRYQKTGVHAAYSPSASLSAVQHLASSTRKKGHRPFAKRCSALSEINPQKPTFGCKQLSGCIHGAPPHTPPKGTFCKKSPWESRKTAFDFYCLVFHRLLPRYQKTGVHAAYSPSASQCA